MDLVIKKHQTKKKLSDLTNFCETFWSMQYLPKARNRTSKWKRSKEAENSWRKPSRTSMRRKWCTWFHLQRLSRKSRTTWEDSKLSICIRQRRWLYSFTLKIVIATQYVQEWHHQNKNEAETCFRFERHYKSFSRGNIDFDIFDFFVFSMIFTHFHIISKSDSTSLLTV